MTDLTRRNKRVRRLAAALITGLLALALVLPTTVLATEHLDGSDCGSDCNTHSDMNQDYNDLSSSYPAVDTPGSDTHYQG